MDGIFWIVVVMMVIGMVLVVAANWVGSGSDSDRNRH